METQSVAEHAPLPPPGNSRRLPRFQELGLVVVILVLGVILSGFGHFSAREGYPNTFLRLDNLVDGVATTMSYFAIMAVGVTFVIIAGGIDISVGSIMALSAMTSAAVLQHFSIDAPAWKVLPVAIAVPLLVGLLCGLCNGILIVLLNLHPFIVTLGTMSIYRGLVYVLPPFAPKTLPPQGRRLPAAFTTDFINHELFKDIRLMPMVVMLVCVVLGWIYLRLTVAGRENYAIGGNEEAARYSGIRVEWTKVRIYALCGLASGIAGMVSLGKFGTASSATANSYELTVIAAAVVGGASLTGGRGTAIGALLGALVIAMIENGIIILGLASEYRLIIIGMAIVLAAALDQITTALRQRRLVRASARSAEAGRKSG
jgi:ribose/xylose/arabinose/galactoside ABC-type transport system permease subunit